MDDCERLAGIEQAIDELKARALCGAIVLVEGKRDREALAKLGVTGEIVRTSHQSLLNLSESLARSKADIIILTDWDERGEEVARQISVFMEADGARPDNNIRCTLRRPVEEDHGSENLYSYVENLRKFVPLTTLLNL
jgi:5S rRNA maturation endonuclease (ribonuclease M5)